MRRVFRSFGVVVAAAAAASVSLAAAVPAEAQEVQSVTPQRPVAEGASSVAEVAPLTPASTMPMPVPEDLIHAHEGGLTADQVGKRAVETSFAAKQSLETMRSAQARVDVAWAAFLPRLAATARYTRLSNFTPPSFGTGSLVATGANPGPLPTPITPGELQAIDFAFPLILDNYLLQATLTIPLSDYLFRTNQNHTAATHSAEAARYDLGTSRATALSNGKVAYYTWLQMRGAVIVAVQALNDQRIHLTDSNNQFTVGNASKADVLRSETAVASAELALVQAENSADLAETQMRIALHLESGQQGQHLVPGEGLNVPPPSFQGNLQALVTEGLSARYEIKSAIANALAAKKLAEYNRGSQYPVVSAFGDGIYANPNPRYIPASNAWNATWDLGIQATWAPNDVLTARGVAKDYDAQARALEAQMQVTRETIEVEITQDWQSLKAAEFALGSTSRELASSTEAYRVARELFNNGRGTSTTLTDAEGELTRARIDALNAAVNARIARVRLEHGVGRDLKTVAAGE